MAVGPNEQCRQTQEPVRLGTDHETLGASLARYGTRVTRVDWNRYPDDVEPLIGIMLSWEFANAQRIRPSRDVRPGTQGQCRALRVRPRGLRRFARSQGKNGYWSDRGGAMEGTPTFDGPEPTDPDLLPSKDEPHGNLEEPRTLREHKDDPADETTPSNRRKEHDRQRGRASLEDR